MPVSSLDPERMRPALEPMRAELLRRANADAQRAIAEAEAESLRLLDEATRTAEQMLAKARLAGEAAGARVAAIEDATLRRSLRREVLAAQDNAYRLWRRRAAEAVLRLHQDAGYPLWRNALSRTARATLGDDAHLVEDPEGGVQAELGRRRLDLSLSAIATRAIDNVAPEADGLWS